jgi:hypothetical protein
MLLRNPVDIALASAIEGRNRDVSCEYHLPGELRVTVLTMSYRTERLA